MTIMARRWIIAISLILSCVVAWTSAFPASPLLQRVTEDDEDELDSDEIELQKIREVINQRLGVSSASEDTTPQPSFNRPDHELEAIEATRLIWKYLSNSGTGKPLQIPAKGGNRTFIIQIVPSNAKGQQAAAIGNALGVGLRGEPDKAPPPPPPKKLTTTTTTPTTTTEASTTTSSTEPTPPPKPPLPDEPTTTGAQVPAHPFEISTASPQPVLSEQEGLNNIEGAILEALSIAQQVGGSPEVIPTEPIVPGSPGQVQVVKVVQVPGTAEQADVVQSQVQGQGSPTDSQQYHQVPQVVFINPYVQTEATTPYIPAAHAIKAVSTLIGSLAEGNLGGVVQSSINLAGTDVVQNSAKLAAAGILHSGVSWVNCQVFRNCQRQNYID